MSNTTKFWKKYPFCWKLSILHPLTRWARTPLNLKSKTKTKQKTKTNLYKVFAWSCLLTILYLSVTPLGRQFQVVDSGLNNFPRLYQFSHPIIPCKVHTLQSKVKFTNGNHIYSLVYRILMIMKCILGGVETDIVLRPQAESNQLKFNWWYFHGHIICETLKKAVKIFISIYYKWYS